MADETCKTCPFWRENTGDETGWGDCRVESPRVVFADGDTPAVTAFPETPPDCWCGRHPFRPEVRRG